MKMTMKKLEEREMKREEETELDMRIRSGSLAERGPSGRRPKVSYVRPYLAGTRV